ncbi:PPOX class FMN-dependent enzyme, alr4036 family [Achlya hypogyna]|uniref:PPOX class FMN-dependent enzyme, alr4036 family n=1 Tax=Achlya hypogyna TaxID=1202772 RepID=A0A1V9Y4L7_ACHHY|nr:PPOX class FMN-dependent enzyme, alr4036 family [Achlya hypogyna]
MISRLSRRAMTSLAASALVPWKVRLDSAIEANRHIPGTHYFQMATVGTDGKPKSRTVVFRGFHDSSSLVVITDARSAKMTQLQANPAFEAAWWLPQNGEQFRLAGNIKVVNRNDDTEGLRVQMWQRLRESMRQQFFWPQPGTPFEDTPLPVVTDPTPPDTFAVLLLVPSEVKYLRLHDNFAQVDTCVAAEWSLARVNP